ncbi:hypothetical protein EZV62_010313 [Acer yangbiense]|uniref:Transposase MuDR plant domain-containing protein n=1 Tax=Acer yangbiense TaxID=1000413 RepID=A0A5C7I308_9ROSI|nr:hypothetical protein EZV62_010313 [Acer yangbiense]
MCHVPIMLLYDVPALHACCPLHRPPPSTTRSLCRLRLGLRRLPSLLLGPWKVVAANGGPDDLALRSKHAKNVRKKGLMKQRFLADLRLLILHGGQWYGQNYEGEDSKMAFVPPGLTYDGLIKMVEDIVMFDSSSFKIEFKSTCGRNTMGGSMSSAQGVVPTLTIPTILEETSQESDRNNTDGAIGSDDEDGGSLTEFETNTDHGLDNLDEQYHFTKDEAFCDFNGEEDNLEGLNCGSPNSSGESDASDHCHASGDDDPVGITTTQRGLSIVPRHWIILGSEQYSFQTINHESSTIDGRFYKGRIFSSKKELKRELRLLGLKQHFEIRIRRSSKGRFQATCKDDNCSFKKLSLVEAYAGVIRPIGHMSEWEIPNEISSLVVHPPPWISQAGQPCKIRKPSTGEFHSGKVKTCSLCKQSGHNRQNCPNPFGLPTTNNNSQP